MNIRTLLGTTFLGAALALSACGGASKVKIDSTDGVTLDGTFQEAIEGLGKADQMKAAAGLLIYAYEGTGEDNRPLDYVEEAKEEAAFLLMEDGGNIFQSRGSVLNEIAKESGGVLNGKTAQDLIDHYNIKTGQYDEYIKDKEEAEAAEKAKKAAEAEAARKTAIAARKTELMKIQDSLKGAASTNTAKRDTLKKAYDAATAEKAKVEKTQKSMAGDAVPARSMSISSGRISGQINVVIINNTDTAIMNPSMRLDMYPKGQPAKKVKTRDLRLYKAEKRGDTIAPGTNSSPMMFPMQVNGKLGSDFSFLQGKDFSNVEFESYLIGYQLADKTKVSLLLDPKVQSVINSYKDAVAKCDAADKAITEAKTVIPAALKALDAPDADPKKTPKLGATTC